MTILVGNWVWKIKMVSKYDSRLMDRTGVRTLGVTDVLRHTIYLNENLYGAKFRQVFLHELGHCIMASYGYLPELHRIVPERYWVYAEEWLCNFLANHSLEAIEILNNILGEEVCRGWVV